MTEETYNVSDTARNLPDTGGSSGFAESPLSDEPLKKEEPLMARIVSIVLHPLFMGVYGVALLFLYTDFNMIFAGQFIRFITPVVFLSCIVPASSMYFLKKAGFIRDFDITNRRERFIPFIVTFCSYSLLLYYFVSAGLYTWFIGILATPLVLIVIAAVTSKYWKVSVHMIGMGSLIGCTLSVCYNVKGLNPFILFIILFILAGCLGVSRLVLRRHTSAQVYMGFLTGLIVSYISVWIGAYWGFIVFYFKNL